MIYTASGAGVRWRLDSDDDIELEVGDETVWLTEDMLEEMLKAIREAKEDVR